MEIIKYSTPEGGGIMEIGILEYQENYRYSIKYYEKTLADRLIAAIDVRSKPIEPRLGDIVRFVRGEEVVYAKGHIEDCPNKRWPHFNVCKEPYIPFVFECDNMCGFYCDTSGGLWQAIKSVKQLKHVGTDTKVFKTWGSCGRCAGGAFCFAAIVNVWEYQMDDDI